VPLSSKPPSSSNYFKHPRYTNNSPSSKINEPSTNEIFIGIGHNGAVFRKPKRLTNKTNQLANKTNQLANKTNQLNNKTNQLTKLYFHTNYLEKLKGKLAKLNEFGIETGIKIEDKKSLYNVYPRRNKNTYKKLNMKLRNESLNNRNVNRSNANNPKYSAFTMPYYGTSLDKLQPQTDKKMTSYEIEQLILSCIAFMKDIQKLQQNKFVHTDLHLGNIIFNEETYQLKMIDFDYLSSYDTFLDNDFFHRVVYPPNYYKVITRLSWKKEKGTFNATDKTVLENILDYTDTYAAGIAFTHLFNILFPAKIMGQLPRYDTEAIARMKNTFHNMTESTDPNRIGPDETIKLMEAILELYNKMRKNHAKKMSLKKP